MRLSFLFLSVILPDLVAVPIYLVRQWVTDQAKPVKTARKNYLDTVRDVCKPAEFTVVAWCAAKKVGSWFLLIKRRKK